MKKILLFLVLIIMTFAFVAEAASLFAFAEGEEPVNCCGENLTWTYNDSVLTISGEGKMTDYYGFSPEGLTPWWHLPVKNIVVEEGVTSIGVRAFEFFKDDSVTSISLPASLTEIGYGAIGSHLGITTIAEGNEMFRIVDGCLIQSNGRLVQGCDTSIIPIDGSVKSIGANAFAGCTGLTEVMLPDSVKTICDRAFKGCKNLVGITLPEGVTYIGSEAFSGCYMLKDINLPESLKYIMYEAFAECSSIESLTLSKNVDWFTGDTFSSGTTLKVYAYSKAHLSAENAAEHYSGFKYEIIGTLGDLDGDGEITVSDALTALRVAAKLAEADEAAIIEGDFDFDRSITVGDALIILRIAAKLA